MCLHKMASDLYTKLKQVGLCSAYPSRLAKMGSTIQRKPLWTFGPVIKTLVRGILKPRCIWGVALEPSAETPPYHTLQECDDWIGARMAQLLQQAAVDSVMFLSQMLEVWKDHCSQMLTIRSIFLYLDRTYVISSSTVRSIFDMGLDRFRYHMQETSGVCLLQSMPESIISYVLRPHALKPSSI